MAIIGARPATLWGIPLRLRRRVSPPPRPGARRRGGSMSRVDASSLGALIAAAVVLALFYLTQSTQVAAMGYQIAQLEAELAERRAAQQQLIWEIGRARSPAEIEARARSELRLKPLKPDVIRFAPLSTEIDR
ncbi:MAG TPA: hypothetical protein VHK06_01845 [Candidatus Limnocylindria bacterium]|nr:hypothetical protein [Candidatus Limnocylindria bacterium]